MAATGEILMAIDTGQICLLVLAWNHRFGSVVKG